MVVPAPLVGGGSLLHFFFLFLPVAFDLEFCIAQHRKFGEIGTRKVTSCPRPGPPAQRADRSPQMEKKREKRYFNWRSNRLATASGYCPL